ncbi:MAG: hypothetical protein NZ954_00430 [Thermofilaceae archaeon]|nr:hypothetical protein [Thermofilaceae archaeon]MCX8180354.1 hypothetical protein [Thermofilaceae archaeon]MDW8003889.1 hypothetical protein [Thermofilaceae archaeon]
MRYKYLKGFKASGLSSTATTSPISTRPIPSRSKPYEEVEDIGVLRRRFVLDRARSIKLLSEGSSSSRGGWTPIRFESRKTLVARHTPASLRGYALHN